MQHSLVLLTGIKEQEVAQHSTSWSQDHNWVKGLKVGISTTSSLRRLMVVHDYAGTGAEGASVGPGSPAYMQENGQESPAYSNQSLPNSESSLSLPTSPGKGREGDRCVVGEAMVQIPVCGGRVGGAGGGGGQM